MISQLKKDLNDETITSICNKIFYYIKPEQEKADTYIEYRILTERESDFAGNKNLTETYYLQVDIFSYGNYKKLAQTWMSISGAMAVSRSVSAGLLHKCFRAAALLPSTIFVTPESRAYSAIW